MGVRRRTVVLVVVDLVAGAVGAVLMYASALPLRAGPVHPSWVGVAAVVACGGLAGVAVGGVQGWFAGWLEPWSGLVGGLLLGMLPVWWLLDVFVVQLTRVMPVPGGGANLDPSPSDVVLGLLLWGGFVAGVVLVVALLVPPLHRRRAAHLERAAQRSTASRIR